MAITDSRLLNIVENNGYDCTRNERRSMALEILGARDQIEALQGTIDQMREEIERHAHNQRAQIRKLQKGNKWKGNSGGAGHGYNDSGLNPVTSK